MRCLKIFKYPIHNKYVCILYPFIDSNSELHCHIAVYYTVIVTTGGASEQVQWRWCQTAGVWYD